MPSHQADGTPLRTTATATVYFGETGFRYALTQPEQKQPNNEPDEPRDTTRENLPAIGKSDPAEDRTATLDPTRTPPDGR